MRTRRRNVRRLWGLPLLLVLCLHAPPALAQVPDATIQRIADLNVQKAEAQYLQDSKQITFDAWEVRQRAINTELNTLQQQINNLSPADQRQANSRITGLTRARLATLQPAWQAKAAEVKQQQGQQDRAIRNAAAADAQKALEPQRERVLLQQRRDRGEITAEEFAAEDKKALDTIMALRDKYVAQGQEYANAFDHQLQQLSQTVATNPAPAKSAPAAAQARMVNGDTLGPDYQRDVEQAADLTLQVGAVAKRAVNKEISLEQYGVSMNGLQPKLTALQQKWKAAGRQREFTRDTDSRVQTLAAERAAWWGRLELFGFGGLAVVVLVGLIALGSRKKPQPVADPVSTVHGTAHYAPLETDVPNDRYVANGVFFGKSSKPGQLGAPLDAPGAPVCSTPEHHTLIVARTRTGKGTRVIIPTLLRYAGSALVIDPKGENAAITARARSMHLQQKIHILNPWNELAGLYEKHGFDRATYNPLDILDRDDPNVVALAQTLAGAVCPAPADGKERFWQGSAANILAAVLLWLTYQKEEQKTLGRAREIVSLTRKELRDKYLIPMAASEGFSGAIKELAAPFIDLAQETYSGVMSNLSESTRFLSDPQMKAATATSSFSMADLAAEKATVYVVIPTDRMDTQKTWLRLIVASAMYTFKHARAKVRPGHRCLFLIDEFAALGRLDDLPRDIATMSGFGVDFALIVQGLDQLKAHYGESGATILSNCAYKWFCNVNDLDSAKYLSDTLGKKTVVTISTSDSFTTAGKDGSSTSTTSRGETARSLLNPDEVLNLGKDVAIALQPHGHPYFLRPVDYWNLATGFISLMETRPALYWKPMVGYDKNPYFSDPSEKEGMTDAQAREILSIKPGATAAEIRAGYLKAMEIIEDVAPEHRAAVREMMNNAKQVLLG